MSYFWVPIRPASKIAVCRHWPTWDYLDPSKPLCRTPVAVTRCFSTRVWETINYSRPIPSWWSGSRTRWFSSRVSGIMLSHLKRPTLTDGHHTTCVCLRIYGYVCVCVRVGVCIHAWRSKSTRLGLAVQLPRGWTFGPGIMMFMMFAWIPRGQVKHTGIDTRVCAHVRIRRYTLPWIYFLVIVPWKHCLGDIPSDTLPWMSLLSNILLECLVITIIHVHVNRVYLDHYSNN